MTEFNYFIPFLQDEKIKEITLEFYFSNHKDDTLPVPIEIIVEDNLGLDVVPGSGLRTDYDIDGYLTPDRKSIYVDEVYLYEDLYLFRYRFTLAHEVGHFVLHKFLHDNNKFVNTDEYKKYLHNFPHKQYSKFEYQAYEFAGNLLVPEHHLIEHVKEAKDHFESKAGQPISSMKIETKNLIRYIANFIHRRYDVSTDVMVRRLNKEHIKSLIYQ